MKSLIEIQIYYDAKTSIQVELTSKQFLLTIARLNILMNMKRSNIAHPSGNVKLCGNSR